ncbi:hypothetical protein PAV_1c12300 [Paenibacillus alvei DSM 29]|nr:hypothetical protein PAV_1c12300 [Paenibacillus alvei DSM 29]
MEFIEIGLKLFVFIIGISLFFALVGFLVKKYLSNFFDKIFSSIKNIFKKRTDHIVRIQTICKDCAHNPGFCEIV